MTRHGLFGGPDKDGWFDFEKCAACGIHWQLCKCGREKGNLEKKLEIASHADPFAPIAAATGIPVGCMMLIGILIMALIVVWGNS